MTMATADAGPVDPLDVPAFVECCGAPRQVCVDRMVECPVCGTVYRVVVTTTDAN